MNDTGCSPEEAALNWVSDHGLDPPLKKRRSWARPIPRPIVPRSWIRGFSKGKGYLDPASCVHYVGSDFE